MSCDFYDETIKRMADITEQSFARQEAILAEIKSEARDFSERTERKLNRIRETVKDVKHNMTRQKIIMTIIIVAVQIISAVLVCCLK